MQDESRLRSSTLARTWDSYVAAGRPFFASSKRQENLQSQRPDDQLFPFTLWAMTIATAISMALANLITVLSMAGLVQIKYAAMQSAIERWGVTIGVGALLAIVSFYATCLTLWIHLFDPSAGGSGAPENKGWLNGSSMPGLWSKKSLLVRMWAVILSNGAGYPVGREGPTVSMGSNMAFVLSSAFVRPQLQRRVNIDDALLAPEPSEHVDVHSMVTFTDEESFARVKRIAGAVGGACGMAMIFNAPIGGVLYMLEETTPGFWPIEASFHAFVGTTACAMISYAILALAGKSIQNFVIYEFKEYETPQAWNWGDIPLFIVMAAALGAFSAIHSKLCLLVARARKGIQDRLRQNRLKMAEAVLFAVAINFVYALVSLLATCTDLPHGKLEDVSFSRFNCPHGQFNPLASLLLTTSEASAKVMFSAKARINTSLFCTGMALLFYTTFNILFSGIPVPSGNFTGTLLIGGLAGRFWGNLSAQTFGTSTADSGVYAMIGAAAMLAGFKQMSLAVVVFVAEAGNESSMMVPLMLSVSVSLMLNTMVAKRGFDEEQILQKQIPWLGPKPPDCLVGRVAADFDEKIPKDAILPENASIEVVRNALLVPDLYHFPVLSVGDGTIVGFTTRARLEALLRALQPPQPQRSSFGPASPRGASDDGTIVEEALEEQPAHQDRSGNYRAAEANSPTPSHLHDAFTDHTMVALNAFASAPSFLIPLNIPAMKVHGLFAHEGAVRAAALVSENGAFVGMITRKGFIFKTRMMEQDLEAQEIATERAALISPAWARPPRAA